MYAGTLGTFHTAAFVKELSLWVNGNKAKRLDLGIIITHLTTTEAPGAIINSGLPAGSSKDSLCDAYLSLTVCNESEEGYLSPL